MAVRTAPLVVLLALLLVGVSTSARAITVTIDGKDTEWTSPHTVNDDPNEGDIPDGYDIDYNYFISGDNGYLYFGLREYDAMDDTPPVGSYAVILLDTDKDASTGGNPFGLDRGGWDYYMQIWLYSTNAGEPDIKVRGTAVMPLLSKWDSGTSSYVPVTDYDAWVARDVNGTDPNDYEFVEWSLRASDVGAPQEFYWAGYIDNGQQAPEDHCPDDWEQSGFTPEPGTLALLALGLPFAAAWRRKRR